MNYNRIVQLVETFSTRKIAVIGDFFLDKYLDSDPKLVEYSVESGKKAHQVMQIRHSPGAAGTVVQNLAGLGTGIMHAIGVVGYDGEAFDLLHDLRKMCCVTDGLIRTPTRMTPTYLKPRDMTDHSLAGEHERYDTKNRTPLPETLARQVLIALDNILPDIDAVIISDQVEMENCGVITEYVRYALSERAKHYPKVFFIADSRTHIHYYKNIIIKPNQFEAVGKENPMPDDVVSDDELSAVMPKLEQNANAPVFITRGPRGMFVSGKPPIDIPGVKLTGTLDTTGAGDSALAGIALALASGATLQEAALIGNLVASITSQQLATTGTATPAQVRERFNMWESQQKEVENV